MYYQNQLAIQLLNQINEITSLLTSALHIHLNIGQYSIMNTSMAFMSLETISSETLLNKQIQQIGNAQINFPSKFNSNLNNNSRISLRVCFFFLFEIIFFDYFSFQSTLESLAPLGNSKSQFTTTNLSTSISFSLLDQYKYEISVETNFDYPIEIIIPRDPNLIIPSMILQDTFISNPHKQLFNLQYINITSTLSISVHWEIHPLNTNLAYLFIYKFDSSPQLNSSINNIDGWELFCPSSKSYLLI
jgi:hypothetical protein